ncbi:hypothetical protein HJFPF1_12295 [Paramyrothecium foliicola]|nr:hypothetical protein HJFPF1_12295 [Paramyrothecium foliicola]
MLFQVCVSAVVAASAASAFVARNVCNPDNCLRALKAASPLTRLAEAQQDCSAYLRIQGGRGMTEATVTGPMVTQTIYATDVSNQTVVDHVISIETVHNTTTLTKQETPTSTAYVFTTVTVDAQTLLKRENAATATIPIYATACSGNLRYTSACSCIGISRSPSTVTLSPSTVPTTVTTKAVATVRQTATVLTSRIVVYDETKVVTVTAPAITVSTMSIITVTKTAVQPAIPTTKLELGIGLDAVLGYLNATLAIVLGLGQDVEP